MCLNGKKKYRTPQFHILVLECKNVFECNQRNHCYSDKKSKCLGPTADPSAFGSQSQPKFEDVCEMMNKMYEHHF